MKSLRTFTLVFFFLSSWKSLLGKESFFSQGLFTQEEKTPIEITGDVFLFLIPTSSLILNLTLENKKEGLQQNLLATGVNLLATTLLKWSLDPLKLGSYDLGKRPNGERYNMPSGHTSIVFTSSFHVLGRYGFLTSLPFFTLASFTAFSRVYARKHDVAAVAAGALLGLGASLIFTRAQANHELSLQYHGEKNTFVLSYGREF